MGLQIRGTLPDGTESLFTLPDSGPTSTVDGWRAAVEPTGYRFIEIVGEGPSIPDAPEDMVHFEIVPPEVYYPELPLEEAGGGGLLRPEYAAVQQAGLTPDNTWLWAVGIAALVWMVTRR